MKCRSDWTWLECLTEVSSRLTAHQTTEPKPRILLIEDSQADILLVRHALESRGLECDLQIYRDGADALRAVANIGVSGFAPDVLLLDMNLPKVDGPQVLSKFREHPDCAKVPVIVISSSDERSDRARVEPFGVAYYFKKPPDYDAFLELGTLVKKLIGAQTNQPGEDS